MGRRGRFDRSGGSPCGNYRPLTPPTDGLSGAAGWPVGGGRGRGGHCTNCMSQ